MANCVLPFIVFVFRLTG